MEGYVPYGWQFQDEDVFVPCEKSRGLNCFGLLSRTNQFHFKTTTGRINSDFVIEQLEDFSLGLERITVVVLDNARVHTSKAVQARRVFWEARGLFLFYLPAYSPELNLIEVLWRELKYRWLQPDDYCCAEQLFYQTTLVLGAVGGSLKVNFRPLF